MVPVGGNARDQESGGVPVGGGAAPRRHSLSRTDPYGLVDDIFMRTRFRKIPRSCRRTIRPKNNLHTIPENEALVIKTVFRASMIHLRTVTARPTTSKPDPKPKSMVGIVEIVEPVKAPVGSKENKTKWRGAKFWSMLKSAKGPRVKGIDTMDTSLLNFV